jgi:hypothetical protein
MIRPKEHNKQGSPIILLSYDNPLFLTNKKRNQFQTFESSI